MEGQISKIREEYLSKIQQAQTLKDLDEIYLSLFGKNGKITLLPRDFSKLPKEELKIIGALFNSTKVELEKVISNRREEVRETSYKLLDQETMDLNEKHEIKERQGYLHPITKFEKQIVDTFDKLGFSQYEAPHIDNDFNNFEALNIPDEHPARDLWDTFYIDQKNDGKNLLLRTHTSNAQNRIMKSQSPPIRGLMLGRCFRYENVDARHEHTFPQFEIVYVDKDVSMANLQYLAEYFLQSIFGSDIKARLRPKYYPFVEPGTGIDGLCFFCKGKGCKICGEVGWLELAGAGMIHPKVLGNGGIDPKTYSGIAWGFGTLRMMMLKYGVNDVRLFNSGDLSFLQNIKEQV